MRISNTCIIDVFLIHVLSMYYIYIISVFTTQIKYFNTLICMSGVGGGSSTVDPVQKCGGEIKSKYRVDSSFNKSEGSFIYKYRVGGL